MTFPIDIILIVKENDSTNYSPFISGIIGILGVLLGYWLKEVSEDYQEEFFALQTTIELLNNDPINKQGISRFYNELRFELRARRLGTFNTMKDTLEMALSRDNLSGDDFLSEKAKIENRLNDLKKRGRIARFKLVVKDLFFQ